jgi:hypothetical protein
MKLAEVATSSEFWNPDDQTPSADPTKSAAAVTEVDGAVLSASTTTIGEKKCNGHQESEPEKPDVVVGNGDGAGETIRFEIGEDGVPTDLPSIIAGKETSDPVNEECMDMQVKIADLGNACWVVSDVH